MTEPSLLNALYFKAMDLRDLGNDGAALSLFMDGARQGNSSAQNGVGLAYRNGRGLENDLSKAIYWLEKAALTEGRPGCASGNLALLYSQIGRRRQAIYW